MKNTPKRLPSVTVRSPLGASPPAMDSQADSSVPTPPMDTGGVASDDTTAPSVVRRIPPMFNQDFLVRILQLSVRRLIFILCFLFQAQGIGVFLAANDAPGPGPKDGGLAALVDDSPQKRILTQKATPPPSPLLSELLKKGNLISASPRLVRANLALNQNT